MPTRRTSELHGHRWSAPGVRYFITACTQARCRGLDALAVTEKIIGEASEADALGYTTTIALCVMPDHLHWLFAPGNRLALGRVIARLKTRSRESLANIGLAWQRDFFEHRLQAEESVEDYARYVFLNPYRAGLIEAGTWRGWHCERTETFGFTAQLNADGSPPLQWIAEAVPERLIVGE